MKTLEQIKSYKSGANCVMLDSRDSGRLLQFFKPSEWSAMGFKPSDGTTDENYSVTEFTKENVLQSMARDLAFSFQKALSQRGISSSLMFEVMKMWMWVLDDELADFTGYPMYGLPLYKAIALKYSLPNPIGEDDGNESKYGEY
jgi:hypothetical protein